MDSSFGGRAKAGIRTGARRSGITVQDLPAIKVCRLISAGHQASPVSRYDRDELRIPKQLTCPEMSGYGRERIYNTAVFRDERFYLFIIILTNLITNNHDSEIDKSCKPLSE